jgi:hypothetical protein
MALHRPEVDKRNSGSMAGVLECSSQSFRSARDITRDIVVMQTATIEGGAVSSNRFGRVQGLLEDCGAIA